MKTPYSHPTDLGSKFPLKDKITPDVKLDKRRKLSSKKERKLDYLKNKKIERLEP